MWEKDLEKFFSSWGEADLKILILKAKDEDKLVPLLKGIKKRCKNVALNYRKIRDSFKHILKGEWMEFRKIEDLFHIKQQFMPASGQVKILARNLKTVLCKIHRKLQNVLLNYDDPIDDDNVHNLRQTIEKRERISKYNPRTENPTKTNGENKVKYTDRKQDNKRIKLDPKITENSTAKRETNNTKNHNPSERSKPKKQNSSRTLRENDNLDDLTETIKKLRPTEDQIVRQIEAKNKIIQEIKTNIKIKREQVDKKGSEEKNLNEECDRLEAENLELEAKKKKLKDQVNVKSSEMKTIKKQIKRIALKDIFLTKKAKNMKIGGLTDKIEKHRDWLKGKNNSIEKLTAEKEELEEKMTKLKDKAKTLETEVSNLKETTNRLKDDRDNSLNEQKELAREKDDLDTEVSNLKETTKRLKDDRDNSLNEQKELAHEKDDLETEVSNLNNQNIELKQMLKQGEEYKGKLENETNQALLNTNWELQGKIQNFHQKLQAYIADRTDSDKKKDQKIKTLEDTLDTMKQNQKFRLSMIFNKLKETEEAVYPSTEEMPNGTNYHDSSENVDNHQTSFLLTESVPSNNIQPLNSFPLNESIPPNSAQSFHPFTLEEPVISPRNNWNPENIEQTSENNTQAGGRLHSNPVSKQKPKAECSRCRKKFVQLKRHYKTCPVTDINQE